MTDPEPITLTESQVKQMSAYIEEQQAQDKGVRLQPAPNLGDGYLELIILGQDGEPSPHKRVLFPT
jgi:hypothetical protein